MAARGRSSAFVVFRRLDVRNRRLLIAVRLLLVVVCVNLVFTGCLVVLTSIIHHRYQLHSSSLSIGQLTEADDKVPLNDTGYYVTICADRIYGPHRTGNQLFMLAAALYVANRTGRTLTMPASCRWSLDTIFQLDEPIDNDLLNGKRGRRVVIERFHDSRPPPCPCQQLRPQLGTSFLHGDVMLDSEDELKKLMASGRIRENSPVAFAYVVVPLFFSC